MALEKKPFEPEVDFERDPRFARIIRALRETAEEKLPESFDERFFKTLENVRPKLPFSLWVKERFNTLKSSLEIPKYRWATAAGLATVTIAVLVYVMIPPTANKQTMVAHTDSTVTRRMSPQSQAYLEQMCRELSQSSTLAFVGRKTSLKDVEGFKQGKVKSNKLSPLSMPEDIDKQKTFLEK